MAGNILGRRSYYAYTADDGTVYSLLLDDSLAAAVGATQNDANPSPPRRFKPRVLYAERIVNGDKKRKELVVPVTTFAGYASNTTSVVTVDGVDFDTTGRRGESLSFPRNADAADPGDDDGTGA